ncbi:MAG TPA: ABC transporter substrate-binding protein [Candidatus Acidoferrales bacterium]|nr:ABC transporter substrate-binding protein [Candidatus Acidoferrales bacterium]
MKKALTLVALIVLALCAGPATAQTTATIRVAAPPSEDVAPILYAMKNDLFTKAGLNVQLTQMVSGAAISAAVAGGAEDVGFSSLQGLISGHSRGLSFQLIAPGGVYSSKDPYAYMVVRSDSPIKSAKDLAGKTIGSPALKDLDWIASYAWIEKNGGDPKSAKFIELPNPTLGPALLDSRIDAFTVGEPWIQRTLDTGKVRILAKSFEAIAPTFLMTGWFSTSEYVAKNRDTVEKFERVIRDAAVYADTHHAEMVPLLATFTKLEPELIAKTIKNNGSPYLDPKLVQPMIDVTVKYQIIDKPFNAADLISPAALKPGR